MASIHDKTLEGNEFLKELHYQYLHAEKISNANGKTETHKLYSRLVQ